MKTLRRIRKRRGRCYELALKAMVHEPEAEKFTLIHGARRSVHGSWFGHAWIETNDGHVYDPVDNTYTSAADYMTDAITERRYTKREMADACSAASHCGPWHDGEDYNLTAEGRRALSEWRNKMRKMLVDGSKI